MSDVTLETQAIACATFWCAALVSIETLSKMKLMMSDTLLVDWTRFSPVLCKKDNFSTSKGCWRESAP